MEILSCRYGSDEAEKAFRLRYQVYGNEYKFNEPTIDHENSRYVDPLDEHATIYVAMKDGEAIATLRSIRDKDLDFTSLLTPRLKNILKPEPFLKNYRGSLAICDKLAISSSFRGSTAAKMITAQVYRDYLDDGVLFILSSCAPYLVDFYSQLGFLMYSQSVSDINGILTPIVLPVKDWKRLSRIPHYKELLKSISSEEMHESVKWFYETYGSQLDLFVTSLDIKTLDQITSISQDEISVDGSLAPNMFASMTVTDIKELIGASRILHVTTGQEVIRNGQRTDEMYIIVKGEIVYSLHESTAPVIRLGIGQALGETEMLTRASRSTYCFASVETEIAIMSRQNLFKLMRTNPQLAVKLLYNLSQSLAVKLRQVSAWTLMQ